jgi:tetratricopeptide (TPR) repeat protein
LPFERWAVLRERAHDALEPLITRGVEVELFYQEQADAGAVASWFTERRVTHDVPAVVESLRWQWEPGATWPIILDAAINLMRAHAEPAEVPALLTGLASIALHCGSSPQAETLAREALYYLPGTPSATRAQALRELGTALLGRGRGESGLLTLDQAVATAAMVPDALVAATALCRSGHHLLERGDFPNAEERYRRAVELLTMSSDHTNVLGSAHHSLAVALLCQSKPDAEEHARAALALRSDPHGELANEDRELLTKIRDLQTTSFN